MSWLDDLVNKGKQTKFYQNTISDFAPVAAVRTGLQNFGFNQQQQGNPSNNVVGAVKSIIAPKASAYEGSDTAKSQIPVDPLPANMNKGYNPGPGYFWDAADGWKPIDNSGTGGTGGTSGTGGTGEGDGGSGGGTGETEEEARQRFIQEQMDLARAKWEGGVKTARSKVENAKKYRDEMKGIIGNKRGEFEKMFQEALGQIGVGASQRIGETGRMAQDMETAAGNRARALGLTGTTAMQMLNRPNDAHARDVFNISQQKTANENENRRLLGERQDWATGKESDLDQYYQNIADEAANLENMAYLNYWNDLSGLGNQIDSYLQSMINTQNQMALMNPQLTGYQASALTPSFQNTMASLQGLSNGLNTKQMPQETDEAVSLVAENPYLKLLRNARA